MALHAAVEFATRHGLDSLRRLGIAKSRPMRFSSDAVCERRQAIFGLLPRAEQRQSYLRRNLQIDSQDIFVPIDRLAVSLDATLANRPLSNN